VLFQSYGRTSNEFAECPLKVGWDAMKKSLDAVPKPVNPKQFRGIKALSPARFKGCSTGAKR
jgi:hypothetical protein